jgi:hypothetical protein
MIRLKVIITASVSILLSAVLPLALAAADASDTSNEGQMLPVERYAVYVASNYGGETLERLRYARSDAKRLSDTMREVGGIEDKNTIMLIDPTFDDVNDAFDTVSAAIRKNAGLARRTEFLFYYSGHSDEDALLLGNEKYEYGKLKATLSKVPSDVHVVMLDSCFSGNFVRSKGGTKQKSFLMDDSTIVQGHAYLASSSEHEESQESDAIQASYFTQSIVTGLRGAADTSGDRKVSLNELYYYAFNETLSNTESSTVGPQHPSYNITLVGSGDLILTDISEAESMMLIPSQFEGRVFIRNPVGLLVSEVNKFAGTEIALALPANTYTIAIVTPTTTSQTTVFLGKGQKITLGSYRFATIQRNVTRSRGNADNDDEEDDYDDGSRTAIALSLCPGLSIPLPMPENVNISLSAFMVANENIQGVQASGFMGSITGDLSGVQAAGFMNTANGTIEGVQASGFMNTSSSEELLYGVQMAGFMNTANGDVKGVQSSGFLNETKGNVTGVQMAGFLNDAKGSVTGVQASGFLNNLDGAINGLQATGFLNIAHGSSKGTQISGFLNIADEITGAQIGVVNIAKSNKGAAIGIFNIIMDGIISPTIGFNTRDEMYIQYQGGTDDLFTTVLVGGNAGSGETWLTDYLLYGFGIGSRIRATDKLSFDLELMFKQIVDIGALEEIYDANGGTIVYDGTDDVTTQAEQDIDQWAEDMAYSGMPSARITANWMFFKHFGVFTSLAVDMMFDGYNERAFTYGRNSSNTISMSGMTMYPALSIGLRF